MATGDDRGLDEPPVVARLVVEIRSDGARTIARGAMEEVESGHKVAIEARGSTPRQLAFALARSMFKLPSRLRRHAARDVNGPLSFARTAARALLPGRRNKRDK